ncbi:Atg29p KNAG_0J01810 [Huiozyma naganishii CBS 8797]|uniref:Autophagy-related protein 29 n=1 Tax=Huiozyma naganishii (strain ATCC MYA-139 / BCRC 22969 / CBS 8797 / KCTC 17520 / NBRC 10181 / NCYC 3082 / Yp74L-3) TaxID=1071383 RepID=J7S2V6_HUIN7|nr:hypothetical protein KNAG_0J01810 [Kazachstania naganishii CBS 8797]CCK72262.1 hypothetical protein KNAG_0J01810 [Kazachstania naganishii CBS 8797]
MDNRNTIVYVKMKGPRPPGFEDRPPFEWNSDKDAQLWAFISKLENSLEQINWEGLSTALNTPIYFLRRRSYKLFAIHMEFLQRQFHDKRTSSVTEQPAKNKPQQQITTHEGNDSDITEPLKQSHKQMSFHKAATPGSPFNGSKLGSAINSSMDLTASEHTLSSKESTENSTTEATRQLHTSRILKYRKDSRGSHRSASRGTPNGNVEGDSDSDLSSSLSVSKSALEEALMDRLHF